ncbi:MAG TPA: DUF3341 domain-containing protein [Phycisphaerales bacterium]|nr:DUF3341 domain-containing protein [Phycisphaerales bacterium]
MAISDYLPFVKPPRPRFVTESGETVWGVMAQFDTVVDAYHAAEKMRDAGFSRWDLYAPFPIHGIEAAMGVKRTILPLIVLGGAFTGIAAAVGLQWWTSWIDYPLVVQGKPTSAWEPYTMIIFELGVLFSAFASLFGMLALNGLPRWNHPLLRKDRFLDSTDDKFFVVVEAGDPSFNPEQTSRFLRGIGASSVELVEDA